MSFTSPRPDALYLHCDFPQCVNYRIQGQQYPEQEMYQIENELLDRAAELGWTDYENAGGIVPHLHRCPRHRWQPPNTKTYTPPAIT